MVKKLKIAIIGGGALGSYYGSILIKNANGKTKELDKLFAQVIKIE